MRLVLYAFKNLLILGIICLFCIPIVSVVADLYQKRKIDYTKMREIPINDDYLCLIDPYKYCSPLKSDGMCYINVKSVNEKPTRKGGRCEACGKYWFEHFLFVESDKDWLKTCKEKDSYDCTNYYAPMGYGDL